MESSIMSNESKNLLKEKHFMSSNSYTERIEYMLTKVKSLTKYREEVFQNADNYCFNHRKSLNISQSYRFEGQYYFDKSEYESAKECFTNAILSAPFPTVGSDNSNELSLCYASRSRVLFELGLYDNALFDANQSIQLSKSEEMLFHKIHCLILLKKFKEIHELINECFQTLNTNEFNFKILTKDVLNRFKHSMTEGIEDCGEEEGELDERLGEETENMTNFWIHPNLQIKRTEEKGRHFVAKDLIPENTLIIKEKPFNVVNFGHNVYEFCINCHQRVGLKIYPCLECNEVVFCGKSCAEEGIALFHKYECGITGLIMGLGPNILHIFRLFVTIGCNNVRNCEQTVAEKGFDVNEYINDEKQRTTTLSAKSESQKLTQFKFTSTLVDHNDKHCESDWMSNTITAIETVILLNHRKALDLDIAYDSQSLVTFANIVCTYLSRLSTNLFGWYEDSEDSDRTHVANCLCLIASLMNHSCSPNTHWFFSDEYISFETKHDIKSGEEINITYGTNESNALIERQNRLKTNYYFDCNCNSCLKSIRTVNSLRCLACDGPVIYGLQSQVNSCLECGQQYQNMSQNIDRLNRNKDQFQVMIKSLTKENNIKEDSIESIETSLQSIIGLVHQKSADLLGILRQLLRVYQELGENKRAIDCSKYLLPSIEFNETDFLIYPNIFADLFDDSFLLTKLYYNYLIDSQNQSETVWETGLQIYNKTIELLKFVKRTKKQKHPDDYQNSINVLRICFKHMKEELKYLNESYTNSKII